MSDWRAMRIGSLGQVVTGATPRTGDDAAWGNVVDFVTPTEMSYTERGLSECRKLSQQGFDSLQRRLVPAGSISFACIGFSTGKVAHLSRPAVTNQQVNTLIPDPATVDSCFAYYLLRFRAVDIRYIASGSTTPIVNKSTFEAFEVSVPDLSVQGAIASVLGALDGKIAVNDRIATTVTDLVSALYEEALERGEPRHLLLGDIADVNRSVTKPKADGTLRYVDIASVGIGSFEFPGRTPWADAPGRARRKAAVGDTIWSTVRPSRRSHALVLDDDPDLVFSTGLAILSPRTVGSALLYEVTRTSEFQGYLESVAEGSAYPAVRADRFKRAPVSLPVIDACEEFEAAAMQLQLRAHQAAVESRTLATLRDTLLPQLMSGKLRVRDAERIVEDAV